LSGLFQLLQKEPGTVIGDLLSVRQLMGLQVMKEIIAAVRHAIPDASRYFAGVAPEHQPASALKDGLRGGGAGRR
jgi:hypothetical protein